MAGVNVPQYDSLAQGLGYANIPHPTSDSCSLDGTSDSSLNILAGADEGFNTINQPDTPLQPMSIATERRDAPGNEQTWNSGDKGEDWMGGSTLPWEK